MSKSVQVVASILVGAIIGSAATYVAYPKIRDIVGGETVAPGGKSRKVKRKNHFTGSPRWTLITGATNLVNHQWAWT